MNEATFIWNFILWVTIILATLLLSCFAHTRNKLLLRIVNSDTIESKNTLIAHQIVYLQEEIAKLNEELRNLAKENLSLNMEVHLLTLEVAKIRNNIEE